MDRTQTVGIRSIQTVKTYGRADVLRITDKRDELNVFSMNRKNEGKIVNKWGVVD